MPRDAPAYQRVADDLRRRIADGEYSPGETLPLGVQPGARVAFTRLDVIAEDGHPSHLRIAHHRPRSRRTATATIPGPVAARMMTSEEAEHLGLAGVVVLVVLVVQSVTVDADGGPVEAVDLVLPADRWQVALTP